MKRNLFFAVALLWACYFQITTAFAQAPQKMSYQAVIRNSSDNLVTNTQIGIKINIRQDTPSGTIFYTETQTPTTNENGLMSIEIGSDPTFGLIDWSAGPYYIETKVAVVPPLTTYTITGTTQLLSVPYALYAANAGTCSGGGSFTHYIGEYYEGGVIFHLWKDNAGVEHGLIIALTDQHNGRAWSNVSTTAVGTSAQSLWDGLNNSIAIIGQSTHTSSAAKLCLDLVSEGHADWYLPSIKELNMLWNNYYTVLISFSQIPGAVPMTGHFYWSSTEQSSDFAYYYTFLNYGNQGSGAVVKTSQYAIRAVRAF